MTPHLSLVVNGKTVAHAMVIRFPLHQALGLLALLVGLVLLTVLMRRRRRHVIDKEIERRLAESEGLQQGQKTLPGTGRDC